MPLRFTTRECSELPRLGWVAEFDTPSRDIEIDHGELVETRSDAVVEGVWSESFDAGNFAQSEHFFACPQIP